tara:strand:+ start:1464 stop:1868 length:405 start_codon:yes stop_codon:yes gene_type:complete
MIQRVTDRGAEHGQRGHYVLNGWTLKSMPLFLRALNVPFWQADVDEPDEGSSEAEVFLLKTLCTGHGQRDVSLDLDEEMILFLLGDEANHLPVMEALSCLLDYDLDMRDVESGLEYDSEVEDVRQIVAQLRLIK